ncbi:MAG: 16S rRNA (guanine(966)-N(2))-methyltransferase RsmD [Clostridia bacterium]|nr:16S rRNA (guanine(966)-N(2))-methyltransferase RsmD [Clostridia bacterium]
MMRIITGRARGTHLLTLEGDATRPTSERAKEAVFSMLQFELRDRRVLDLFAGSGQMSLEAISRGAESAVLVDASPRAVEIIRKNIEKTHFENECTVLCADYADAVRRTSSKFDLIILDPPYAKRLVAPALRALLAADRLADGAIIVCESAEENVFESDATLAEQFAVRKVAKYGAAYVTILDYKEKNDG